jgi:hypothetical protein
LRAIDWSSAFKNASRVHVNRRRLYQIARCKLHSIALHSYRFRVLTIAADNPRTFSIDKPPHHTSLEFVFTYTLKTLPVEGIAGSVFRSYEIWISLHYIVNHALSIRINALLIIFNSSNARDAKPCAMLSTLITGTSILSLSFEIVKVGQVANNNIAGVD